MGDVGFVCSPQTCVPPPGVPYEVWAAIINVLGVAFPELAAALAIGADLFDWIFGSGHAGSCGIFREQYFGVKSVMDPLMDAAVQEYSVNATNLNVLPTAIMNAFAPTILAVIQEADAQFDQFKGSNLLGQTMFASRLHLYLFLRWMGAVVYLNQQWDQEYFNQIVVWVQTLFTQTTTLQNEVNNILPQLNAGNPDHQALLTTIQVVQGTYQILQDIINIHIPNLLHAQQAFYDFMVNNLSPEASSALQNALLAESQINSQIFPHLALDDSQILGIQNQLANTINPELQQVIGNVLTIQSQVIPSIQQTINGILAQIPQVLEIPNLQQGLQTLTQHVTTLEQQKAQVLLPQLQNLAQALGQLANQLQNSVIPKQLVDEQNITNIQNFITNLTLPNITDLQTTVNNINNYITQTVNVDLDVVLTFINNFRKNVGPETSNLGCAMWGAWAECWLTAYTPAPEQLQVTAVSHDPTTIPVPDLPNYLFVPNTMVP